MQVISIIISLGYHCRDIVRFGAAHCDRRRKYAGIIPSVFPIGLRVNLLTKLDDMRNSGEGGRFSPANPMRHAGFYSFFVQSYVSEPLPRYLISKRAEEFPDLLYKALLTFGKFIPGDLRDRLHPADFRDAVAQFPDQFRACCLCLPLRNGGCCALWKINPLCILHRIGIRRLLGKCAFLRGLCRLCVDVSVPCIAGNSAARAP